jgi:hypothetical protein
MSFVPSRSLSPDRALDSDEADIGEGRRVPGWESEDRITQEPGRPNSEVLKPSSRYVGPAEEAATLTLNKRIRFYQVL